MKLLVKAPKQCDTHLMQIESHHAGMISLPIGKQHGWLYLDMQSSIVLLLKRMIHNMHVQPHHLGVQSELSVHHQGN